MSTKYQFFIGTCAVQIASHENFVRFLIVANTRERAFEVLDRAARRFYGDDSVDEDGEAAELEYQDRVGYEGADGEVYTKPMSLTEIGLSTFLECMPVLTVYRDENIPHNFDFTALQDEGFKAFAGSVTKQLTRLGVSAKQSAVLNALSGALGERNWQVLRTKLQTPAAPTGN